MGELSKKIQNDVMTLGNRVMTTSGDLAENYRARLDRIERQIALERDPQRKQELHVLAAEAASLLAICSDRSGK